MSIDVDRLGQVNERKPGASKWLISKFLGVNGNPLKAMVETLPLGIASVNAQLTLRLVLIAITRNLSRVRCSGINLELDLGLLHKSHNICHVKFLNRDSAGKCTSNSKFRPKYLIRGKFQVTTIRLALQL